MSRARLSARIFIALVAVALAACGSTSLRSIARSARGAAHGVAVTPGSGHPTTTFHLSFIAPASSGTSGGSRISYSVGVSGPTSTGCIGATSAEVSPVTKGDPVAVALDPATLGGSWCVGVYAVRVLELQRPVCAPGAMCPQYVRVVETVGTAAFRVVTA